MGRGHWLERSEADERIAGDTKGPSTISQPDQERGTKEMSWLLPIQRLKIKGNFGGGGGAKA